MKTQLFLLCGALLLTAVSPAAEIFRWVNANGHPVYSDRPPPPGQKAQRLVLQGAALAPVPTGNTEAVAPSSGDLTEDVKRINSRIDEHNLKTKQDNCLTAKQHLANLEAMLKPGVKPDESYTATVAATKEHVRTWCGG